MKKLSYILLSAIILTGCSEEKQFDATGTFESANEIIVSGEANGKIIALNLQEGDKVSSGQILGYIDTTQLHLTKLQLQKNSTSLQINKPDIEIIQLGGIVRHSSASVVSEYAERMLDNFACSKLFLGVDGIDPEYGLSTTHLQEAILNRAMIAAATKTVVLADSSKFGRRGFSKICDMGDIDHVITDSGTPPKIIEAMQEHGIKVTVAELGE